MERILRYPFTMIGSDGEVPVFGQAAPHPRSYGTFARVLGRYVREKHTLTLEDAVHRMTGLTAARLKLFDRGLLRPGMKADLAIFDPATVARQGHLRAAAPIRHRDGARDRERQSCAAGRQDDRRAPRARTLRTGARQQVSPIHDYRRGHRVIEVSLVCWSISWLWIRQLPVAPRRISCTRKDLMAGSGSDQGRVALPLVSACPPRPRRENVGIQKTLAVMQILASPGFLAEPALRLFAQLPKSHAGATCLVLLLGEVCEVLTDECVHRGVSLSGMPASSGKHLVIYAERNVLHLHSVRVTGLRPRDDRG